MRHETVLTFEYSTRDAARLIERALRPEVGDIDTDRGEADLTRSAATLEITIRARDLSSLRASLNTWLSLVGVAETTGLELS